MSGADEPPKLFGRTVVRDGKLLVGTFLSVLVGGPLYALILEGEAWINFVGRGIAAVPSGILSWIQRWVTTFLDAPETGFLTAQRTFSVAVADFGLLAYFVSLIVASAVIAIVLLGVTRVI